MAKFFVATQIGAEENLKLEVESVWFLLLDLDGLPTRAELPEMELVSGGIEMDIELHLGLQLNFFLRLANRVLYRIAGFKARFYDQFEKSLSELNLKSVLPEKAQIALSISHGKSRLNNEKNLIESATRAFKKQGFVVSETSLNCVFIRIASDFATISLDTSGEHLHFRGYRTEQGEAPIRETLAAQVWSKIRGHFAAREIELPKQIIDPFCGSGTILIEAILNSKLNAKRSYAFQHWKNIPAMMKSESFFQNYFWLKNTPESVGTDRFFGIDLDDETLQKAVRNVKRCEDLFKTKMNSTFISSNCSVARIDLKLDEALIVSNPPYGERLSSDGLFRDLELFINNNQTKKMDVFLLLPIGKIPTLNGFRQIKIFPFNNQGLKLNLVGYSNYLI